MTELSLTLEQRAELQRCERVIQSGLETFELVGNALLSIRDAKLHRETHGTFEEYCRDKWNLKERQAYKMMDAAKAVENLKAAPMGQLPKNERQVRPLTSLEPEQQCEAWTAAVEASDGKPTAKHVEAAVEEIKARDAEPEPTEKKPVPRYVPADGLQYAEMAILNLEKIQPNDTQREAAFARVTKWITKNTK